MNTRQVWDCHAHVIGDAATFPVSPARSYDPPHAPLSAYLELLNRLSVDRGVLVQPSVYSTDHRCLMDALRQSNGRLRGIAVPAANTTNAELWQMHIAGVRGIRCNLVQPSGLTISNTKLWWNWMIKHGWHLEVQVSGDDAPISTIVRDMPMPLVIDHLGLPNKPGRGENSRALLRAISNGLCYVKLSAPYRFSSVPYPHKDALALAAACLAESPEHCLWASDWPHTAFDAYPVEARHWLAQIEELAAADWSRMCSAAARLYDYPSQLSCRT